MDDHALMQRITKEIMYELIDEVTLSLCFEVHRSAKLGTIFLSETDPESERNHQIVDTVGKDVFGQAPVRKQFECLCPNCQRNMVASRFAPHLEKCMGMGRNSSRVASKRIANSRKSDGSDNEADNDDDTDWTDRPSVRPTVGKDKKNKKIKSRGIKNGETAGGGRGESPSGSTSKHSGGGSGRTGGSSKKTKSKQDEEAVR